VIFTHAALKPAHNNGCGSLPGKVGHPSYTVILNHLVGGMVYLKGFYKAIDLKKLFY
jgi:hypothetical protein